MVEVVVYYSNWNGVKGKKIVYRPGGVIETLLKLRDEFLRDAKYHGFTAQCELIAHIGDKIYYNKDALDAYDDWLHGKLKYFKCICVHCEDSSGYSEYICYPS